MNKVNIFEPTPEQDEIISTVNSALVNAGPGTGKTRTAIEKAKIRIRTLPDDSSEQVLFLSFSNAAIYRLATDLNIQFSKIERKRTRFMTYHSCAAEILRLYGRFVGLPSKIRIMDTLEEKLTCIEQEWSPLDNDHGNKLSNLAKKQGLLAFETLIPFATKLLCSSSRLRKIISRKYPLIIVDEFQDTSEDQWKFLCQLGMEAQVVAFGDPNQIIYSSLHAATVKRLDEFKKWKGITESRFSTKNHRSNREEILEFANSLLTGNPFQMVKDSAVQLRELRFRNELRSCLALIWKAIQEQIGSNQTIGFLAPNNLIAEEVAVALRNPPANSRIRFPVYCYLVRDEAAHDAVLLALTAIRDYAIWGNEVSLKKAAGAMLAMDLAWTRKKMVLSRLNSIMSLLEKSRQGNAGVLCQLMQNLTTFRDINMLVTTFIDALAELQEFKTAYNRMKAHEFARFTKDRIAVNDHQLSLFDEFRTSRRPKGLEGYEAGEGRTYILNYHKAKGREFDFVIMIIDPRGENTKVPLDEQRRLYYVCATRAKKWLGVLYYRNEFGRVLGPVIAPA